jgi:hypothetical protein
MKASGAILVLFLCGIIGTASALSGSGGGDWAHSKEITVGPENCNYTKIQGALDAASSGDTILVSNGTYYECLVLTKPIILKGIGKPKIDMGYFFTKTGSVMQSENMGACDLQSA